VVERGIADSGHLGDVELATRHSVVANRAQSLAALSSKQRFVCDPVEVGAEVKVALVQLRARVARGDRAQLIDPVQQCGVASLAIGCVQNRWQDTKQLVVPMQLSGGGLRMVILQEAPNLRQGCKIIDLGSCKLLYDDA